MRAFNLYNHRHTCIIDDVLRVRGEFIGEGGGDMERGVLEGEMTEVHGVGKDCLGWIISTCNLDQNFTMQQTIII